MGYLNKSGGRFSLGLGEGRFYNVFTGKENCVNERGYGHNFLKISLIIADKLMLFYQIEKFCNFIIQFLGYKNQNFLGYKKYLPNLYCSSTRLAENS